MSILPTSRSSKIILAVVLASSVLVARFALPVRSAPVTPSAAQKLTVYGGVIMLLANGSSVLEVGNAGRDIASNDGIAFRPGSTDQGSLFTGDLGYCSVDRTICRDTIDCSGGQTCVNNVQNLTLTGNLNIGGQLCFNGLTDCRSTWPSTSSLIWSLNVDTLSPSSASAIRVGNSSGYCANLQTMSCYDDLECPLGGTRKCMASNGVLNKDGFVIVSDSAQPALRVTKSSTFGQSDVGGVPVDSGSVLVNGRVNVNMSIRVSASPYAEFYPVWYKGVYTDTQDGSGIDADTIDGMVSLPFRPTSSKNFFWKQYYVPPAGTDTPSLTVGTGGDPFRNTLVPLLCLRTTTYNKVCSNGPKAGTPCDLGSECPAADTCGAGGFCTIVTNKSCTVDADCPSTIHTPTCAVLYTNIERQCIADNIWSCSNEPTRTCLVNTDCLGVGQCQPQQGIFHCSDNPVRTCTTDLDCTGSGFNDGTCVPGQIVPNVPAGACSDASCDDTCAQTVKCNGKGFNGGIYVNADKFGTRVNYNKGECITDAGGDPTNFCRCSLNLQVAPLTATGKKYVPYLDASDQQGGGDMCSGSFTDDSLAHPLP